MIRRIGDLLAQRAREAFIGRSAELEVLLSVLDGGPQVVFVHGIAGIGKSTLLGRSLNRRAPRAPRLSDWTAAGWSPPRVDFSTNSALPLARLPLPRSKRRNGWGHWEAGLCSHSTPTKSSA